MNLRNIIFWMHLVTGLTVGSVIFIMALTGSIMAFEPQLVDWAERDVQKVDVPNSATTIPLSEIIANAEKEKGKKVNGITIRSEASDSVSVSFGRGEGSFYVNPYTGKILGGISKTHEFMHWVEDIHRRLGTKDKGKAVTGFCNAAFLFMVISGLFIWWPRNWNMNALKAILLFNGKLRGKQRDWNWHNVIGFWCLPLLLVTTLTGLIMSYGWANQLFFRMTGSEPPQMEQRKEEAPKPSERQEGKEKEHHRDSKPAWTSEDLDRILLEAKSRVPDWKSINVRFSQKPSAPVTVSIQESKEKHSNPNPRSQMSYDLAKQQVVKWEPFSESSAGKKLRVWVRYLHTGEGWGLAGQIAMFISAIGVLCLVWTGFALSWRRFFTRPNIKL